MPRHYDNPLWAGGQSGGSTLDAFFQPINPIAEMAAVLAQHVEPDVLGNIRPGDLLIVLWMSNRSVSYFPMPPR